MFNLNSLRRKRLKAGIKKRKEKQEAPKEELEESEESYDEEGGEQNIAEPPQPVYPDIPQLKLEEINRMAAKYRNSDVRLSIKAKDVERITYELIALRDEALRLRQCIPTTSFEDKSLIDSDFQLEVPSEIGDIEINDLEDL